MKKFIVMCNLGLAVLTATTMVHAQENTDDNAITCVENRLTSLSQSDAGKKRLETVTPLTLGEECGSEYGWTLRKSSASGMYAVANILLQKNRGEWASTGFAEDLPDRIKKRMTFQQHNETILQGKEDLFTQILSEELVVTGSKLNADGSVDKLSLLESNALGQKIGRVLIDLFLCEETRKIYHDAAYDPVDFFVLLNAIAPDAASDLEARLK